jgi:H+/Cl- antiporter ClcA
MAPPAPPPGEPGGEGPARPGAPLRQPGYQRLLLVSALAGVPVSLAAFGFLSLEHELQHLVWESLPRALGEGRAPWWWPLVTLPVAGLLAAPVVLRMPGHGGHVPAQGLGGGPALPAHVPGTVLAALICLPLGAVLGPEAPLMGLGSGLALMAVSARKRSADPRLVPVLGTAGSAAAISTVFGSPLVAGLLVVEAAGVGGARLVALVLPCLLTSGIGGLVFTGFGHWTGLAIGNLTLPSVPEAGTPDAGDFLWGVPLAVLVGLAATGALAGGRLVATWTRGRRRAARTVCCAAAAGLLLACYALATGRSPEQAALSGQATLAELAAHPHAWPVSALVLLVLFKALAWAVCLGALRGGPIFPAILIGAAAGVAAGGLPGLGIATGLGAGMAAATAAVTRLPLTSVVLATLLVGGQPEQTPLLIVAALASLVTAEVLRTSRGDGGADHGASAAATPAPHG